MRELAAPTPQKMTVLRLPRRNVNACCVLWRGRSTISLTSRRCAKPCVHAAGVRQDAELLSDPGLSHASSEALRLLDSNDAQSADLSAAVAAVAAVVGGSAEVPPTSAETSRLVESQPEERDSALLDIFVEEATEVAAAVRTNYAELQAHHGRRDVLVDIRRAFIRLKGSGRMVGQTDLAEVAWRVERVLNGTLERSVRRRKPNCA